MMSKEAMKLALEALENWVEYFPQNVDDIDKKAITSMREELSKPDFWEGYVPEPVKPAPVQDNPLDCGVHLGSGKDHAIKHHVSYGPAQPVPDAFEQLMREADKPTQVLQDGVAEYVDALINGTHEITSVTIRPKRTWVGLTQEEFRDFATTHEYGTGGLIRAIEAKLKEKNT